MPDWPHFRWDSGRLLQPLEAAHRKQGRLYGLMERFGFDLRLKAELQAMANFWQRYGIKALNERQTKVLNRYLDGFEGKLTARKWAVLAKCSIATAQRDIKELADQGILIRNEGGSKNTSYAIIAS